MAYSRFCESPNDRWYIYWDATMTELGRKPLLSIEIADKENKWLSIDIDEAKFLIKCFKAWLNDVENFNKSKLK